MVDDYSDEYDVYADGECIGSVELPENATAEDMPDEIEINGVYYLAQK